INHVVTHRPFFLFPATLVAAFEFTSPDSNQKLNVSAPIRVTWTSDSSAYDQLDLWFMGVTATGTSFGYDLKSNISTSVGMYNWDPYNVTQAWESTDLVLVGGKEFQFQARLHDRNTTRGAMVQSDYYAVVGYDNISNLGASNQVSAWGVLALAGVVVIGLDCKGFGDIRLHVWTPSLHRKCVSSELPPTN
ncbi:uncharacterized protein BCR38DRAFT_446367, partial [Pseudomassariella vexata]